MSFKEKAEAAFPIVFTFVWGACNFASAFLMSDVIPTLPVWFRLAGVFTGLCMIGMALKLWRDACIEAKGVINLNGGDHD